MIVLENITTIDISQEFIMSNLSTFPLLLIVALQVPNCYLITA